MNGVPVMGRKAKNFGKRKCHRVWAGPLRSKNVASAAASQPSRKGPVRINLDAVGREES